jgi:glycolate oxidase FAD binding subunit
VSISAETLSEGQRILSTVQDSNLAHTSLQVRAANDSPSTIDVLFDGTEEGIAGQVQRLGALLGSAQFREGPSAAWSALQALWTDAGDSAIAKFSVLPAKVGQAMEGFAQVTRARQLRWSCVAQATGVGWLRLDGDPESLHVVLTLIRSSLSRDAGSLVLLPRPRKFPPFDVWGDAGDALPLMRAIKTQFDPKNTLNPGRFVGGI